MRAAKTNLIRMIFNQLKLTSITNLQEPNKVKMRNRKMRKLKVSLMKTYLIWKNQNKRELEINPNKTNIMIKNINIIN